MKDLSALSVKDSMTANVLVIEQTRTIGEFIERLDAAKVHGMPVIDDKKRVVGVVSLTDMVKAEHSHMKFPGFYTSDAIWPFVENQFESILHRQIGDIMTREVISCRQSDTLAEAARIFARHGVHRLLVLDDKEEMQGILSVIDVVRAMVD